MTLQGRAIIAKTKTKQASNQHMSENPQAPPRPEFVKLSLAHSPSLSVIPKLVAESSLDRVGGAGGLRIYLPARMAKDRQFPFRPGELARMMVLLDGQGREVGLILAKKAFLEEFETVTKTWAEDLPEMLKQTFDAVNIHTEEGKVSAFTKLSGLVVAKRLLAFILGMPEHSISIGAKEGGV